MVTIDETAGIHSIDLLGCTVRYRRQGSGPSILFLHGANGVSGWTPWMARLAERFDVIVPDHPGFGASDTPGWFDNVHDLAYYYLDFIKALGLSNVHLIGHSVGGWIAAEVAVRNTSILQSVTLVSAAGLRIPGLERMDMFMLAPEDIPRELFYDQKFADAILANPRTDELVDLELKNSYSFARLAWQPRLYDPHLEKWLHRIDVPTLLLWGDSDKFVPPEYAAEFKRLIPQSSVRVFSHCGHMPQVEAADMFLSTVSDFITGNVA